MAVSVRTLSIYWPIGRGEPQPTGHGTQVDIEDARIKATNIVVMFFVFGIIKHNRFSAKN
jgi:hypothetical protein